MKLIADTHIYKTVGDCRIHADVYQAPDAGSPNPAIIFLHGGCLIYGSRKSINRWQLEIYLNAGYTVISADYRLAPETKLPEIIADLEDLFRWIHDSGRERLGVDPERIAVVGHSAGGYLALIAGCTVIPRPRAVVSFYGYGDIVGDWYGKPDPFYCTLPKIPESDSGRRQKGPVISEPYDGRGKDSFYLFCRQNGLWPLEVGGRDPETDLEFFEKYCPVKNITDDYPPTLMAHGDRDTDVPYEQSVLVAKELSKHRIPNRLITIPGGGHGFDNEPELPAVVDTYKQVITFLHRWCA